MLFLESVCPWGDTPSTASPCHVILCQAEDCSLSTSGLSSGTLSANAFLFGEEFRWRLHWSPSQKEEGNERRTGCSYSGLRVACKHTGVWSMQWLLIYLSCALFLWSVTALVNVGLWLDWNSHSSQHSFVFKPFCSGVCNSATEVPSGLKLWRRTITSPWVDLLKTANLKSQSDPLIKKH